MEWFKRSKKGITGREKKEIKDNLWIKCEICKEIIYKKELEKVLWVCPFCGSHFRVNSDIYKKILIDQDSFFELDQALSPVDALKFKDKKSYSERIKSSQKKTNLKDAIITGLATINNHNVAIGIMDFSFMGGSMGSVVGEKIARLIQRAVKDKLPVIIVSASGGARMQEGTYSLMQMAKTSAALALLSKKNLLYISVLTHPTTGGTTASFAMLGDINIAEPGALIGFAGPRVIRETIRQELPEGFQRAEFLLDHGFVDLISNRKDLKNTITKILDNLMDKNNIEQAEKSDLYIDAEGVVKYNTTHK